MSFEKIVPGHTRTTNGFGGSARPPVRITLSRGGNKGSAYIVFNEDICRKMNWPLGSTRISVEIGRGDDLGVLRLQKDPEGYKLSYGSKLSKAAKSALMHDKPLFWVSKINLTKKFETIEKLMTSRGHNPSYTITDGALYLDMTKPHNLNLVKI